MINDVKGTKERRAQAELNTYLKRYSEIKHQDYEKTRADKFRAKIEQKAMLACMQ